MGGRKALGFVLLAGLIVAGCSEPEPEDGAAATEVTGTDVGTGTGTDDEAGADTVLARHRGEEWFLGPVPDEPAVVDTDAEPIVIGLINQEDTPLGSYPEIRRAVEGGVEFINAELGGVDGRPLELHTCVTSFSPEQSAACAQEMEQLGVVALVGGLDVTSNGSIPVLEQNGIAQVGGIPANLVEQQSDVTFFFSGGVTGALAAFLSHVADNGGDEAVLAYGEFESFAIAANDYARPVAEHLGVQLDTVSYPITATDFLPVLTRASETDPDAIIMAAAGAACAPIMQTYEDLGIAAQLYLVGACADDEIIRAADGAHQGVIFNSEGPPAGEGDVDGGIYASINELYADEEGGGAGTVGMRSLLNLYAVLSDLGADGISREAVLDELRGSVDRPGFWGHPYTCDGNQVAGLPSLCAPQQSLITVDAPGDVAVLNEQWYDTVELFGRAL